MKVYMVFKQFTLGYGRYIREFGSRIGYHFQDTDQLFKDFSLDRDHQFSIKNIIMQICG